VEDLKKNICTAFCDSVAVRPFDGGLAVGMPYSNRYGDRIGVYVLDDNNGLYKLVDHALTISYLEADGVNFESASRRQALYELLAEYRAQFDEEMGEVFLDGVDASNLPKAVLDFSALLLRINDLFWLASDRVRNTFRDDIKEKLRKEFGTRAIILEDEPVTASLNEITPDMVLRAHGRDPVALFIATDEAKLWQAMHLRFIADYEQHFPLSVVVLLQRESSVSSKVRIKADNRLDATLRYEEEPELAIQRLETEVFGRQATMQ
jgi:hypothetical protein